MKKELPHAASKYGADMGQPSSFGLVAPNMAKLSLQRVHINSQGYDRGGAYWGIGQPLYWCGSHDGKVDMFLRARDREHAKAKVRTELKTPAARFYR